MANKTGGAAFPSSEVVGKDYLGGDVVKNVAGMTLRDYFAAKALPTAMTICWADIGYPPVDGLSDMQQNARLAYQMADAMIAERAK